MISRFLNFVPNTENLLEYTENNKSPNYEYIRANNLKIESQKLKGRLIEKGFRVKDTILKEVFKVEKTKEEEQEIRHCPSLRNNNLSPRSAGRGKNFTPPESAAGADRRRHRGQAGRSKPPRRAAARPALHPRSSSTISTHFQPSSRILPATSY